MNEEQQSQDELVQAFADALAAKYGSPMSIVVIG